MPDQPNPPDDGQQLQEFVQQLTASQTRIHAFIASLMPDSIDTVSDKGVTFVVTPGSPTIRVVATIGSDEAEGGKLFGRLRGIENSDP